MTSAECAQRSVVVRLLTDLVHQLTVNDLAFGIDDHHGTAQEPRQRPISLGYSVVGAEAAAEGRCDLYVLDPLSPAEA